jgi:hypothetical protein
LPNTTKKSFSSISFSNKKSIYLYSFKYL